jgi:Carboxypeptidase regulatory-like domain
MWLVSLVWIVFAQVPTVPLTGTVVGPGGEPVIGAELVLVGLPSYDPPVVARGKSGEGGRFSLDRPTTLAGDHHPQRAPILWVVKPGLRAAAIRFPEALPPPDEPVRIALEPSGKTQIRVEGPDGGPLSGVKVLPERLKTEYTNIPDEVAMLAAGTTGPDGLTVVDAVAPDELIYVDVHSREFGIQGRPIVPTPGKPRVITLRPASTCKGRLSGAEFRYARGWRVKAWTRVGGDPNEEPQTAGYVETMTDDEGRFALAPIAVGGLQLELKPPGDLPVLADLPQSLKVREGREESVDIPLQKAVTVTGRFLEQGTGKPVPGISAMLIYIGENRHGSQTVTTDEGGRFTFQSLPGKVRVGHFRFPPTHVLAPSQGWEDFTVPEPPNVVELPTREALRAAPPLRGRVVDEAGQPVSGASIQASLMLAGARGSSDGSTNTKTDEKGEFVLAGLGPGSTVSITARLLGRQSKDPVKFPADEAGPVTIAIVPMPVFAATGRVLGTDGTPRAAVPIKVLVRAPQGSFPGYPRPVWFADGREIKTTADGSFTTPNVLERKPSDIRIEVAAAGYFPARTPWVPAPEGDLLTLPELRLKRSRGVRIVSGRVVDGEGKAVTGASVLQAGDGPRWTSTKTDAAGRFRLPGVAAGAAMVFADAPGFRFGGAIAGVGAEPVGIRLARVNEPPVAAIKPLASPLSRTEERAIGGELLEPLLAMARSSSPGADGASAIWALARVLEMIENRVIANPSAIFTQAVLGLYEDNPTAAIAAIDDDRDPGSRAAAWLALEAFRPVVERARRENLLERALADARQAASADVKVGLLGQIADRWLELGSIERARPILLEGQRILADWPKNNWPLSAEGFADVLAAVDFPAATAIFERRGRTNVSPPDAATIVRHNRQAAIRLAGINPAEAERLIAPASPSFYDRGRIVLKVACEMAKVDLPRSRRLLEMIDDKSISGMTANRALVPFGLGEIAGKLARTNPIEAKALLDEAFAGLRKIAIDGDSTRGSQSVANLMANLLPVVERVEPDRLAERIWLIAGSRGPAVLEPTAEDLVGTFTLAMRVARYNRAVADVIAAAELERLPDLLGDLVPQYAHTIPTIVKSLTA